jgi:site-specific DNA-methyltransferase (adenine-specific)
MTGREAIEPVHRDELAVVYMGDALEVLRALPSASVDAVVTDPPAGISFMSQGWDTFPVRRRRAGHVLADGRARPGITGGQEHDPRARAAFVGWLTAVMAECRRLLKPGGHALVWAIPRTSHWTATAIEDGGFEVRDVVHHLFGQGFPKSLDVGRAIELLAAADDTGITAEAGEAWAGLGTALKPAAEHWILARRPLAELNVAANVVALGTGALNIDACRVGPRDRTEYGLREARRTQGVAFGEPSAASDFDSSAGRWPANLVLSHAEGCRPVGSRRVPSGTAVRHRGVAGGAVYSRTLWRHDPGTPDATYAGADGLETVEAWECVEGCPVAELDRQSGVREGGHRPVRRGGLGYAGQGVGTSGGSDERDVAGGASRFFYVAKASTADRNAGLVGGRNRHPTVKPVELMRWLVRLVTPPGGLVLDCFAGSGSTLVAAKLEGLRSIGVERDPESVDTCARRLAWAVHQPSLLDDDRPMPAGGEAP